MWRTSLVAIVLVGCGGGGSGGDDVVDPPQPEVVVTNPDGTVIAAINLAQANVGQGSTGTLRVTNSGQAATGPLALAISGSAANDFVLDNAQTTCAAKALAPAESCDVVVLFRPTAVGDRVAMLSIASSPGGTHDVTMTGHAVMPDLHFNPASVSFNQLEIGQSAQTTIEVRNDGSGAAPIDSIGVTNAAFTRGLSTCGSTLAPGASCDIIVNATPQALGAITGSVTVTSAGQTYAAGLTVHGARKVTIVRDGTGSGTVTSTPAALDCGTTCTALVEGAITLMAVPSAMTAITSWSIAGCAQATTCVVPADITPITVNISFASTASSSVNIVFAGNGTGEVQVRKSGVGVLATCFADCPVPVQPGDLISIRASTYSTFAGFSGDCTAATAECAYTVPGGASTITATFQKDPKEQWTRFLPGAVPHAAAYDGSDNLIVASTTKLTKLGPTGSTIWTLDLDVASLETGPGDTIYIVTGNLLKKLDSTGAELWARAVSGVCTRGHAVAVASDGAVAVRSGGSVSRWDAAGTLSWTKTFSASNGRCSVAIDSVGNVLVDVENANFESTDARRYAPDGSDLTLQTLISQQYLGLLSSGPNGDVVACTTGHSTAYLTAPSISGQFTISSASTAPNWCAMASSSAGWLFWRNDFAATEPVNWNAYRYTAGNVQAWVLARVILRAGSDKYGTAPFAIAGSASTGRIALVGHHLGITADTAWVQVYDP